MTKIDSQVKQVYHEVQILAIKVKEKEQEVRLNDLKLKEFRKQVPNTKLKPLDRKDKVNLSVDNKKNTG